VRALTGGGYRLRVGDWRVVFTLDGTVLRVTVVRVAHRREVYRKQAAARAIAFD